MPLSLLALCTALIEAPAAVLLLRGRDDRRYILCVSALLNLLTNLLINAVCMPVMAETPLSGIWDGYFVLLLSELVFAYLAEGLLYALAVDGVTLGRGMIVSGICNTVSFALGLGVAALAGPAGREAMVRGFALLCGLGGVGFILCLSSFPRRRRKERRNEAHRV